jgi:hypothetical protein
MRLWRYGWVLALWGGLVCARTARAEGPGIALGERLVLHPGIGAEIRYDSNIFYEATNEKQGAVLRLTPWLDLATRPALRGGATPHTIDFRFHAGLDYREYLTSDQNISQHRQFGVQGGLLLSILPFGPFTTDIFDNFVRSTMPPYNELPYNFDRDTNEAGVRFRIRPGGGRLELSLSYVFGLDYFEVKQLQDFNAFYHRLALRVSWKFLPKTAIYIEGNDLIYKYWRLGDYMHPDSYALHVIAGLQGLITTKLTLNIWVGYDNGFYVSGPSPNSASGGLDIRWKPIITGTGVLGYKHDFANSLLGSYYDLDMAYLGWSQLMWRITGSLRATYANQRFQGITPITGLCMNGMPTCSRTDNVFQLNVRFDLPLLPGKDWFLLSIGYDLSLDRSDSQIMTTIAGLPGVVPVNYTKHEAWLQLTLAY